MRQSKVKLTLHIVNLTNLLVSEEIMSNNQDSYSMKESKSNKNLAIFTGLWLVTTALLAFGPKLIWSQMALLNIAAIVINLVSGGFMVWANIKHLQNLDELAQKIFLNSAAITLGVLMVVGVSYELIFLTDLFNSFAPKISHLYFVMGFTFILSTYLGHRKYK